MKKLALSALVCASLAAPLAAQQVSDCDGQVRADAIAEPWERNTRTFANRTVRLALLDTIEPAVGAYRLLILAPPYDELGARQCKTVGLEPGLGFAALDFGGLETSYDPDIGLTFFMRAYTYDAEAGTGIPVRLEVTLNQTSGAITAIMP